MQAKTGSTQASIVEQALAIYRAFLESGGCRAEQVVRHLHDKEGSGVGTSSSAAKGEVGPPSLERTGQGEKPESKASSPRKRGEGVVKTQQKGVGPLFDSLQGCGSSGSKQDL